MSERPRVLVIEDDPLVLMMTILDLQADGFEVAGAGTPSEAFHRLAQAADLDALVLDLDLRGGDAFALAHAARASNPDLAVIYTSGLSQPGFEARRVEDSILVAKPTIARELAGRLRDLLG